MRGNGSYSELFSAGSGNRYVPVTALCNCKHDRAMAAVHAQLSVIQWMLSSQGCDTCVCRGRYLAGFQGQLNIKHDGSGSVQVNPGSSEFTTITSTLLPMMCWGWLSKIYQALKGFRALTRCTAPQLDPPEVNMQSVTFLPITGSLRGCRASPC